MSCDLLLQVNTVNNTKEGSSCRVPENEICKLFVHISADTCTNCNSLINLLYHLCAFSIISNSVGCFTDSKQCSTESDPCELSMFTLLGL